MRRMSLTIVLLASAITTAAEARWLTKKTTDPFDGKTTANMRTLPEGWAVSLSVGYPWLFELDGSFANVGRPRTQHSGEVHST